MNRNNKVFKIIMIIITIALMLFGLNYSYANSEELQSSSTVESIKMSASDEALSFTNLLIIILISLNIVLIILAVTILMKINKKI